MNLHGMGFYMYLPFAMQAKFLSKEGWLAKTGGNNRVLILITMPVNRTIPILFHVGMEGSLFCACEWKADILQK